MKKETIEKFEKFDVIELYNVQRLSVNKIGKIVGSNKATVSEYLQMNGIILKYGKPIPKFDLDLAETLFKEGNTLTKIAETMKIDKDTLSKYLKLDRDVFISHNSRVQFNEFIFDSIDTEEKAYWLGFIYADGNISTNGFRFTLKLAIKDLVHLEKFNRFMEHAKYNINITNYENCHEACEFVVYSRHLWESLNRIGCTPNKSLTLKFPEESVFKSPDLIRHFIRGYFDGDGCFWRESATNKLNFNVLGTEDMLNSFQKYFPIKKLYSICNKCKDQNITKSLTYKGEVAKNVANYLFDNSKIFLDRKHELYQELKEYYNN